MVPMEAVEFTVQGMHCESCARALSSALGTLPGVLSVCANAQTGCTSVSYDPERVDGNAILRQIEDAGFDVIPA